MNTRIQHYDLDEYSIDKFRDEGHVCLCDVGQAHELEPFRMAVNEATEKQGGVDIPLEERDTYGKAFQQHMNLWEIDDRVKEFILNPRYGKIAADLLGVNGVRIYHDQALYKEPGGGPTPWHQDQYYWPVTGSTITMWMPLVDISVDMGMLTFASRSHTEGYLGTLPISDESDEIFARYVRDKNFEVTRQSSMKAGDATSGGNATTTASPPEFASTHPSYDTRLSKFDDWMPDALSRFNADGGYKCRQIRTEMKKARILAAQDAVRREGK